MYLFSSFWATVFCLAAILLNLGPEWPWPHTLALVCLVVGNGTFFALARWFERLFPFTLILLNTALTFWLWLYNQGALGSVTFFWVAAFLFSFLLLRGRRRILAVAVTLGFIAAAFVLDALTPGLTDSLFRYPNRVAAIEDIGIGLGGALLILALALNLLVKTFDIERQLTHRRMEDLSRRAHTDSLTGLGNRAWINLKLAEALDVAEATGETFSIILADVDHFKAVNDQFGHAVGDEVLKGVAAVFRQSIRRADQAARYGGEEFLLLLRDTSPTEAALLAEKIRSHLAVARWPGTTPSVTSSFGVAGYRKGDTAPALVHRADLALYRAKAAGRNLVMSSP